MDLQAFGQCRHHTGQSDPFDSAEPVERTLVREAHEAAENVVPKYVTHHQTRVRR